jgi:hypothetical protein
MDELLSYAISDADIRIITGINNVIRYQDIQNYDSVDDLLKNVLACFILFETKDNYGHWTVIFRNKNLIEFFDPYGVFIEKQKLFIEEEQFREPINWLSILLKKSPYQISYNEIPFQNMKNKTIGTCGKWCIMRWLHRHKNLYDFEKMIKSDSMRYKMSYDRFIAYIFFYLFNI